MRINAIVSMCINRGIGSGDKIQWKFQKYNQYFDNKTIGKENNAVVMGKDTWLNHKCIPFDNRYNYIVSSKLKELNVKDTTVLPTIDEVIKDAREKDFNTLWIIGGEKIYKDVIRRQICDSFYITYIDNCYDCDKFLPILSEKYLLFETRSEIENNIELIFNHYAITYYNKNDLLIVDLPKDDVTNQMA